MKKVLSIILVALFIVVLFAPHLALGQESLVTCGNADDGSDKCEICDFFNILLKIYDFIVKWIAAPLAVIAISVGAIFILASAGNPSLFGTGKNIVYTALIGLFLVFASWLIIDFILHAIGYVGADNWWYLSINC